jgi:uncharacterized protein YqeY
MNLQNRIKALIIEARYDRNEQLITMLSTLYGAIETNGKNKRNGESTDDEAIAIIKKFIDGINLTLKIKPDEKLEFEKQFYIDNFLPKQLSYDQLKEIIQHIHSNGANHIGMFMKELKTNYAGIYNGNDAKEIIDEILK